MRRKISTLIFGFVIAFGAASAFAQQCYRTIPPGIDDFSGRFSSSTAKLTLPIGGIRVFVQGPFMVRRDPAVQLPDGRCQIPTEITAMRLEGQTETRQRVLITRDESQRSTGSIKQVTAGQDFPADSFFDVFTRIQIGTQPPMPNRSRLQATLGQVPPAPNDLYGGPMILHLWHCPKCPTGLPIPPGPDGREGPVGVVVEDFNLDGNPDLVVAHGGFVSVLLGDGRGGFSLPPRRFPTEVFSQADAFPSLVTGDFNNDGCPDLATSGDIPDGGAGVSIALGDCVGGFNSPMSFGNVRGGGKAVGDFNGDGNLDVAMTTTGNQVCILFGDGQGRLGPQRCFPVGSIPVSVAAADFNGDKFLDLAVANRGSGTISILLGNGNGTFGSPVSITTGISPTHVIAADFDGDGILDLAVANSGSSSVSVHLGFGDGTFAPALTSPTRGQDPVSLVAGDFDGDGVLDLAVVNRHRDFENVAILLGNGDGRFRQGEPRNVPVGLSPNFIASGDFNGDGALDLVVANTKSDNVSLIINGINFQVGAAGAASETNGKQ